MREFNLFCNARHLIVMLGSLLSRFLVGVYVIFIWLPLEKHNTVS
jgi:hypothetical protein